MKRVIAACVITLLVTVSATLVSLDYLSDEGLPAAAIQRTMRSAVLGEERRLIVHLPESYDRDTARRYPVIYVLDGSSQDIHTARSAALMARIGDIPEAIVVGLPNVSAEGRQRDYTPPFMARDVENPNGPKGQADSFLSFLKDEVLPLVDRDYRTTAYRMLSGHSRGGLLVTYSLIAGPAVFAARFAHSTPLWREDSVLVRRLEDFLRHRPDLDTFFYLSIGSRENENITASFNDTRALLTKAAPPRLRWKSDVVYGADHQSNGEKATPLGLKALFADPDPPQSRVRTTG
jgi:predicted alpha/beta superfamily hydrolase